MWDEFRTVVAGAVKGLVASWRSLAVADLAYKTVAFALLTPGTMMLLRWMASRADTRVVADADIVRFFATTGTGISMLVLGSAIVAAITAVEMACLMAIGLAGAKGTRLDAASGLAFGASRAAHVLALTGHMVVRVLLGLLPFVAAIGAVYLLLLREHDINFYLAERPPVFFVAAVIAVVVLVALVALLVRTIARWALALPLVLFEGVLPRRALSESARRSRGHRGLIAAVLASWAIVALALVTAVGQSVEVLGRGLAPQLAGSLPALLAFLAALLLVWFVAGLIAGIVNVSLLALSIVRLYLHVGAPREPRLPQPVAIGRFGVPARVSRRALAAIGAIALLAFVGLALFVLSVTRRNEPVAVIAHRGASATAPENTLAAFRLAAEQGADFVELDVQESADGEVVVVHDSDLMKVGGSPLKVWETSAAELRSVDIGSHKGPQFGGERVPTLAEALEVCKGKARVVIELKSYGHDERLEERVAEIVEAAGMADDCVYMSLDHEMIARMKQLRPTWRCGVLVAKAVGDLTTLHADFLAVEARVATPRFVRRAHRAGQEVYVWTVNDPAWMLAALSRGVDGLITDKPDVARHVIARRAGLTDGQRLLVALLVRLGATTERLAAESALRP